MAVFLNEDDVQIWTAAPHVFDHCMGVLESGLADHPACVLLAREAKGSAEFAMSKLDQTGQAAVRGFVEDGFVRGVRESIESERSESSRQEYVKEAFLLKVALREFGLGGENASSVF